LLQFPASLATTVAAKAIALVGGWLIAWVPGLAAMILWKSYGGHLYAPETLNLLLGHLLRMTVSGGVAVAAAAIAESAASAAIVTLGFTLGTWVLDFIAAGRGGLLQELANYTPTAALRVFEQGQLRASTVIVMLALSVGGFVLATVWLHTGRGLRYRLLATLALSLGLAAIVGGAARLRQSSDLSENRRNSFSRADEAVLRQIREPLHVTVFLSPEDPRLMDLDRSILSKLKRILPRLEVDYAATSRSGLFEDAEDHYGEIWYEMGERKVMNRSTTEAIVLEQLYELSGLAQPEQADENEFTGYPLAARPQSAALVFYILWPLATVSAWWLIRYQRS
jgi:hypothetical protein